MKSILSLLIVLFSLTGLFAQNVCTVKILFAVNKTNPPSYTFKTDPHTAGAKYLWTFGDNTVSDSPMPTHTFSKGGSYVVHVQVKSGTDAAPVTCSGALTAQFDGGTKTSPVVSCKVTILASKNSTTPASYTFKTDPQKTGGKYSWTFGDNTASDSPTPSHTFSKTGTYSVLVKVIGVDGTICYGESKSSFDGGTVTTNVVTYTGKGKVKKTTATDGCGLLITMENGKVLVPKTMLQNFEFKDGQYVELAYELHPNVASGCSLGVSAKIIKIANITPVVTPVIPCKVTILANKNSTNPLSYSFKSDPSSTASTTKYFWTFGDETPVSDTRLPSHIYSKVGTYVVKVKVTNGTGADAKVCYGELNLKVEAATVTPPVVTCTVKIVSMRNSTTPASYTFKTDPQTSGAKYYWTFGDNTLSDSPNPSHTFSKAGTYSVVVKVVSGDKTCTGELKTTFDGSTLPPTLVTHTGRGKVSSLSSVTGCNLVITTLENNVRLIPANITPNFILKEGQYVEFTYQKYAEKITTCKEGADIKILTIKEISVTTLPNCKGPINLLLFDPTSNLCNGSATVKLLDEAGKEIPNVIYLWSDGRTGSSAGTLCPGKLYTVQATIENVCRKTTSFTLLSKPLWQSTSVGGVNNFTVVAPLDGVQYEWNFGNGVTKIGPSVSYNFQNDGIYDVQLKAVGLNGASESTKQVVVMKSIATTDVINKSEVDLYPNPAKEIIRVDFKNPTEGILKVEIKNISGRSVYIEQITNDGSSHADINIQNLNSGIYVLRISNDQRIIGEKKFIKAN
ncbi:MAG: PKD domain-containing protein [Prolixibacteraceae bacterium]|jgi:PKD repeat protein|nr:PKD domain-containing protein [Prolixibacteraceae bacterium]